MAHMVETMAYAGEVPWHGLGKRVLPDLTPEQMMEEAGVNWTVRKVPAFANVDGRNVPVDRAALVRDSDGKVLSVVGTDWNPVQNSEAFEFFNDFVAAGDMEMHTAGSLRDGQIVWALAKVKDSFSLAGGRDQVDSYLLFTNPQMYGKSIDVRFTPIRVVCNNTLTLSLNTKSDNMVKVSHRTEFNADQVKETLGIAHDKMSKYKEMGAFLSSKRYTGDTIVEYFKNVFPLVTNADEGKARKDISKGASTALDILESQPGADFAPGSWWNAYNAVTYYTDHLAGRTADSRLTSAWYGPNRNLKLAALEKAVEFANAA
jgi:phage/plasmid-like protein (TIGR03299 family)